MTLLSWCTYLAESRMRHARLAGGIQKKPLACLKTLRDTLPLDPSARYPPPAVAEDAFVRGSVV